MEVEGLQGDPYDTTSPRNDNNDAAATYDNNDAAATSLHTTPQPLFLQDHVPPSYSAQVADLQMSLSPSSSSSPRDFLLVPVGHSVEGLAVMDDSMDEDAPPGDISPPALDASLLDVVEVVERRSGNGGGRDVLPALSGMEPARGGGGTARSGSGIAPSGGIERLLDMMDDVGVAARNLGPNQQVEAAAVVDAAAVITEVDALRWGQLALIQEDFANAATCVQDTHKGLESLGYRDVHLPLSVILTITWQRVN
ncbi:hypothetical protein T484DRAFT_1766454 [Baffinella frigidus]|nr:hypothetical protein T484DRAFT_1766454 [Cryptophyta sp. CCMP2293]